MYNRYIRNDQGEYQRIPQDETPISQEIYSKSTTDSPSRQQSPPSSVYTPSPDAQTGLNGLLKKILGKFKLDGIDRGDLLLLLLLLFLFADGEDDELLIALALLLIL